MNFDFLIGALDAAGQMIQRTYDAKRFDQLDDFRSDNITKKSPHELVIKEDVESESIIIDYIKTHDGQSEPSIFSEELDNLEGLRLDQAPYKYVIDPLDGTHNFCFGIPYWGISVGVVDQDLNSIAGYIHLPMLNMKLRCSGPERPAEIWDEQNRQWFRCQTAKKKLGESLICYDNQFYKLGDQAMRIYENITKACFTSRITGSAICDAAFVAMGKVNARIWNNTNSYDIAAAAAIVRAAGGFVSDFVGRSVPVTESQIVMCSDRTLFQELAPLLQVDATNDGRFVDSEMKQTDGFV